MSQNDTLKRQVHNKTRWFSAFIQNYSSSVNQVIVNSAWFVCVDCWVKITPFISVPAIHCQERRNSVGRKRIEKVFTNIKRKLKHNMENL